MDGSNETLIYRGGVELVSSDSRFGGLSGLLITEDGSQLLAISDQGWWYQSTILYDQGGNLVSIDVAELLPMVSADGQYVGAGDWSDAEAVLRLPNGELVVAFERHHRLWRYSDIRSSPRATSEHSFFSGLPRNRGIEALVMLDEGRLLALAESGSSHSSLSGWILKGKKAEAFHYPHDEYF